MLKQSASLEAHTSLANRSMCVGMTPLTPFCVFNFLICFKILMGTMCLNEESFSFWKVTLILRTLGWSENIFNALSIGSFSLRIVLLDFQLFKFNSETPFIKFSLRDFATL